MEIVNAPEKVGFSKPSLRFFAISTTFASVLLSLFLSGCGGSGDGDSPPEAVRPVKLISVEAASTIESRSYPAIIKAATYRELSFQVSGLIEALPIKEGAEITQGAIIAQLDRRDFQSRLDAAQSQFNNAKAEYDRAVRLDKENAIAKSSLELRSSQLEVAQSQLETATKALEDTVLRAPIDGRITKLNVDQLQNVQAGMPIVSMIGNDGLQAVINVPAGLVSRVNQRKDKTAFVTLDTLPDQQLPATFGEATLEADTSSQTFRLAFRFEMSGDLMILPGMTATVTLSSSSIEELPSATAVPMAAILAEADTKYVWLVDESTMKVSKREIQVGEMIGESLQVTSGLDQGDIIVGAGAHYLSEGMEVRPWVAQ